MKYIYSSLDISAFHDILLVYCMKLITKFNVRDIELWNFQFLKYSIFHSIFNEKNNKKKRIEIIDVFFQSPWYQNRA